MGYNIEDVGVESSGGPDQFTFTLDRTLSNATTVSGDFNEVSLISGEATGEADSYSFSALSDPSLGTLSFDETTGEFTFEVDWAAVFATGESQIVTFTVTGTSGGNTDTDTVTIELIICVARGTLIAVEGGTCPVEDLRVGDKVLTADGKPEAVRWIGSRKLSATELSADPSLRPIRIRRDALGHDRPSRDLVVSPQHRVLLQHWQAELLFGEEEMLVPAKALVNDSSIRPEAPENGVEYFHVLFDRHEIMLTEGLPTESFFPGSYSLSAMDASVRDELLRLFPDIADEGAYGPSARPSLCPWEGRLLGRATGRAA